MSRKNDLAILKNSFLTQIDIFFSQDTSFILIIIFVVISNFIPFLYIIDSNSMHTLIVYFVPSAERRILTRERIATRSRG